jgi:Ca2+-binding EF-hand superfamily protein
VKGLEASDEVWLQVFASLDTDGSGYLDHAELLHALNALGLAPTSEEMERLVDKYDSDKDGKISRREFKTL